ncbi:MAG: methyltransferase domain-containing protein, partial [Candidatus Latescibacteria bacterium]|nr:methyltransferase domain-containing protein [Candidatus Latescibacterota bacterium]
MDPTKRFSDRVQDYVKYRPSYPDALIDYLIAYTGIPETATVADLGSGTGIFSGLLLERGFQVFGVEPNTKMRRASVSNLSDFPAYKAVNASAEKTTLDDQCADLITAAQSF